MELNIGDYVVHHQHGVGKYMGIITRENNGMHQDYLRIIYKGNDELLVPLSQFKLIRRYVAKEGVGYQTEPSWQQRLGENKTKSQ